MSRPRRSTPLRVLVVGGDGARSLALAIPRWALRAGMAAGVIASTVLGLILVDYAMLRWFYTQQALERQLAEAHERARDERGAFEQQLAEEQQRVAALQANLDTIRRELAQWPTLKAAIVTPFGRAPSAATRAVAAVAETDGDLDDLTRTVRSATRVLGETADLMRRFRKTVATLPTRWPVRAAINSEFGVRRSPWGAGFETHRGIDIAAAQGTPVQAPADGEVVFTGNRGGYGLTVVLEHARDLQTMYAHLSGIMVRPGQRVQRGQVVGRAGSTGRSTGPHLHYEVLVAKQPVNPRPYLWD